MFVHLGWDWGLGLGLTLTLETQSRGDRIVLPMRTTSAPPVQATVPQLCGPYAYCSVDEAVACTRDTEMGTAALVRAEGQDNAQGPSNEHSWAPLGNPFTPKPLSPAVAAKRKKGPESESGPTHGGGDYNRS